MSDNISTIHQADDPQRQQSAGGPTVKGWGALVIDPETSDIIGRGVIVDRIGDSLLIHIQTPVGYGELVPLDDMRDVLLFPDLESLQLFLEFHKDAGGADRSLYEHYVDTDSANDSVAEGENETTG